MAITLLTADTLRDIARVARKARNMQAGPGLRLTKAQSGYVLELIPVRDVTIDTPHGREGEEDEATATLIFWTGGRLRTGLPTDLVQVFDPANDTESAKDKGAMVEQVERHCGAASADHAYFAGGRKSFQRDPAMRIQRLSFAEDSANAVDRAELVTPSMDGDATASSDTMFVYGGRSTGRGVFVNPEVLGEIPEVVEEEIPSADVGRVNVWRNPYWQAMDFATESVSRKDDAFPTGMIFVSAAGPSDRAYVRGAQVIVPTQRLRQRNPGDLVVVSGFLGGSKAWFQILIATPERFEDFIVGDPREAGLFNESSLDNAVQRVNYSTETVETGPTLPVNTIDQTAFASTDFTYFWPGRASMRWVTNQRTDEIEQYTTNVNQLPPGHLLNAIEGIEHVTDTGVTLDKGEPTYRRFRPASGQSDSAGYISGTAYSADIKDGELTAFDVVTVDNEFGETSSIEKFDFATETPSIETGGLALTVEQHAGAGV